MPAMLDGQVGEGSGGGGSNNEGAGSKPALNEEEEDAFGNEGDGKGSQSRTEDGGICGGVLDFDLPDDASGPTKEDGAAPE